MAVNNGVNQYGIGYPNIGGGMQSSEYLNRLAMGANMAKDLTGQGALGVLLGTLGSQWLNNYLQRGDLNKIKAAQEQEKTRQMSQGLGDYGNNLFLQSMGRNLNLDPNYASLNPQNPNLQIPQTSTALFGNNFGNPQPPQYFSLNR